MKKSLKDLIKLILPMNSEKRRAFGMAVAYIDNEDLKVLEHFLKMDRCFPLIESFGTSEELFEDKEWPFFKSHLKDKNLQEFLSRINEIITEKAKLDAFLAFAPYALERIIEHIAPNIIRMDAEKHAAAIQLFAVEPLHLLLIGDPGTGKTDILRSVNTIAPISSFGLGSGVSGVGLSASAKGDKILKGLLPLADGGICCIDELNLIKGKDLAGMYNAMEKGFVNYDKGGTHETLPADVRVCATANPASGTFVGNSAEVLKKQMPFSDPLLSRFHFIFVVRKPGEKEFEEIAKKIVKGTSHEISKTNAVFLGEYIKHAWTIDVKLDSRMELQVLHFVKELKKHEKKFLSEIGPRTVVGIVRVIKAVARSELATQATQTHIDTAFSLIRSALYLGRKDETA